MSTKREAWIVAAVEELKNQGFCRFPSTLISLHQHAMNNLRSILQATKLSSSSSAMVSGKLRKSSQSDKSLSKAMYLIRLLGSLLNEAREADRQAEAGPLRRNKVDE